MWRIGDEHIIIFPVWPWFQFALPNNGQLAASSSGYARSTHTKMGLKVFPHPKFYSGIIIIVLVLCFASMIHPAYLTHLFQSDFLENVL